MATRKRKLPDRKRSVRKEPGLVVLAARACLRLAARNPGAVLGTVGFLVVFGCVAANAFWYQPGRHPSPFLRTRDPHDFSAMLGLNTSTALNPHPNDVTTFLIQRQDKNAAASPVPVPEQAASGQAIVPATAPAPAALADVQTVVAIQTQLARLGLYDGPLNGERDARTNAAISAYQQRMGVSATGQPSEDLLTVLAADKGQAGDQAAEPAIATVHPLERPSLVKVSDDDAIDPVAAAIRSAEKKMVTAPATKASVQVVTPVPKVGVGAAQTVASAQTASAQTASVSVGPGLVMDIQRGLINVAYTGITVDGVVGDKTKAAIRHFQRHYRLPETGEPDMAVLKTLKSIGAL